MSNYVKTTNFAAKDALATGNPSKVAKGTEVNTEFDNIATAIATKEDLANKGVANGYVGIDASGNVSVTGNISATGTISTSGNASVTGTLGVTGLSTFTGGGFLPSGASIQLNNAANNAAANILNVGTSGNSNLSFRTASTDRLLIGNAGNVTINAPSSGITLALSGVASGTSQTWTDGTVTAAVSFSSSITTFGSSSNHATRLISNGAERILVSAAGNVAVNAPSSGISLSVSSVAGGIPIQWNDGTLTGGISLSSSQVQFGSTSNHAASFYTNNLTRMSIAAAGNVTINAPDSGVALDVAGNGVNTQISFGGAGTYSASAFNKGALHYNTTGGILTVDARSNSGSTQIDFLTSASGTGAVRVRINNTDGSSLQATDDGGTLQTVGWRDVPQSTNTTLALADRGKHIFLGGTTNTVTIPTNATTAFPVGSTVVLVNDGTGNMTVSLATDTLDWFQGGAVTTGGTRTVATKSVVTLLKVASTRWVLSGSGIS